MLAFIEAEFELECLRVTPTPMDGRPYLHHEVLLACSRLLPSSLLVCDNPTLVPNVHESALCDRSKKCGFWKGPKIGNLGIQE